MQTLRNHLFLCCNTLPVIALSTVHDDEEVDVRHCTRQAVGGMEVVKKLKMIVEYNTYMCGVDRADQLLVKYGFSHFRIGTMCIQCALIVFTLHFSRNRTSTLHLRMSRDCHARTVVLVKNDSSTSSSCTAGVAVGFSTIM